MKNSKISHAKGQLCRAFQKRRKAAIAHNICQNQRMHKNDKKKDPLKNQDNKKRMNGIGTIKLNYACGAIWS